MRNRILTIVLVCVGLIAVSWVTQGHSQLFGGKGEAGRYKLHVVAEGGAMYKIDSATGDVWLTNIASWESGWVKVGRE